MQPKIKTLLKLLQAFTFRLPVHANHGRNFWDARSLLHSFEDLSRHSYWKKKYQTIQSGGFDWFVESHTMYPYIQFHIEEIAKRTKDASLSYAELGCGMSELPLMLFKTSRVGLQLFLTDYVSDALHHQANLFCNITPANRQSLAQFVCADILNLPFKDNSLHMIVDKGTMDAVLKDKLHGQEKARHMFAEVMRVLSLSGGGRFIQVTDEDPDSRLQFLENCSNSITSCQSHLDFSQPNIFPSNSDQNFTDSECSNNEYDNIMPSQRFQFQRDVSCSVTKAFSGSWSFKVITDVNSEKEYFMYWFCEKR